MSRLAVVLATVTALAGVLAVDLANVAICDGSYELSVTVKSLSGSPIKAVSCEAISTADEAQYSLEHLLPPDTRLWSTSAEPFTGEPLSVVVPFSFRASPLGRTWGDSQFRSLLVIVRYQDGRQEGRLVEIPHRKDSRAVTVEVP